ncbi:hypothetical protein [Pelagerythrobacter sp.]|uniref:hypothetical protein n=1 Tax=Pelagerythrobacter sp. TaxID=2800702 RepID=UPI0035B16D40
MSRAPSPKRPPQTLGRVFALPIALFAASCAGLVLGLTGEGAPDLAAWALLALPIIAILAAWQRRNRPSQQRKT